MNDTKKPENPKAFPNTDPNYFGANDSHGMDLRDYFANSAIRGMTANSKLAEDFKKLEEPYAFMAQESYKIADAMLKHREFYNQK